MKFAMYLIVIIVGFCFVGVAYIRLAPSTEARWHTLVSSTASVDKVDGAIRVIETDQGALARVDAAMQALPRTQVLAGSVRLGRITYITRTAVIGFPDYTTVEYSDGLLKMHARLRFGVSDLGVNRKRLERLLVAVQEG